VSWTWRYENADGDPVRLDSVRLDSAQLAGAPTPEFGGAFPTQSDAESWIGEEWRALLAAGVARVTLLEGDRIVYGPMSLDPDAPA
jgi:hypothetical protein